MNGMPRYNHTGLEWVHINGLKNSMELNGKIGRVMYEDKDTPV